MQWLKERFVNHELKDHRRQVLRESEVHGRLVEGVPWLPVLINIKSADNKLWVWFEVDTGADCTVLSADDARVFGFHQLGQNSQRGEITGYSEEFRISTFKVEANMSFLTTNRRLLALRHRLHIPIDQSGGTSLIGRDVIFKFFDLEINPPRGEVILRPKESSPFRVERVKFKKRK